MTSLRVAIVLSIVFLCAVIPAHLPEDYIGQVLIVSGTTGVDVYAIGLKFTGLAFTTIPSTIR